MSMIEMVKAKAKSCTKNIVLPEGDEVRTVEAASIIKKEGLANPILIGNPDKIAAVAKEINVDITGIEIQDPETDSKAERYANELYELRKAKGVDYESACYRCKWLYWSRRC